MLQLQSICKSYTTGDFTQTALDNVSVSFRDNEFVAILGPSGSGKTTLLNIVGGLDHYDSGNLVIDGISTRQYKDRDWDAYRNNRIGFVFQSYNLIPHQTVLANVELALTLSGVSSDERKRRSLDALDRVGLKEHAHKKPSQLSGGQMQRVAIARALINDPEILLADEPTGALDSKTSVQVMELLTEIAHDRLVIMVTHNPELADQYATRIVNLSDGVIVSDTDPFEPSSEDMRMSDKPVRRTSMSFLTALSLSFNNLMTKKGRTIMTAFAGSIGIIGIAAILSLANGVNDYIKTIEEETLSEYPLQITSSGFDMTSMMSEASDEEDAYPIEEEGEGEAANESAEAATDEGAASQEGGSSAEQAPANEPAAGDASEGEDSKLGISVQVAGKTVEGESPEESATVAEDEDEVRVLPMVSGMFASIGQNDLASLKEYLESGQSGIEPYTRAIEYSYGVVPQIFSSNTETIRQVNPDKSMSALGLGSTTSTNSLMSMTMSTDVFYEMPSDPALYEGQYDVVAGAWPKAYNECVLVLTSWGGMSDFMLYTLGLRDSAELDEMVKQFAAEEEVSMPKGIGSYSYDEILGITFKLVNAADFYSYDSEHGLWLDKQDNEDYMRDLVANGEDITVVGIVVPREDANATMLMMGVNYPASLTDHVIDQAKGSQIVQDQLADPDINVFTGKPFGEEEDEGGMDSLFSIDTGAIQSAFSFDTSKLAADMSNINMSFDPNALPQMPTFDDFDIGSALGSGSAGGGTGGGAGGGADGSGNAGGDAGSAGSGNAGSGNAGGDAGSGDADSGSGNGPGDNSGSSGDAGNSNSGDAGSDAANPGSGIITPEQAEAIAGEIIKDFIAWQAEEGNAGKTFSDYLDTARGQNLLNKVMTEQLGPTIQAVQDAFSKYLQETLTEYLTAYTAALQKQMQIAMQLSMAQMMASLSTAFSFDASVMANAFSFDMTEEELGELILAMMTNEEDTYDNNLKRLGYASFDTPSSISIYPIDFESKEHVISILDAYNDRMEEEGQDDKVISYTDIVGALMESVTDIVNMISYVLIAFVAISLVVSSIMIGVITYISVLERKKEIGILRAIGASKGNISSVFNAETVIEGLVAGLLGVGVTALICIPASAIIYAMFDVPNIAQLPLEAAVVLVIISVVLTTIAGIIPSSAASRKDPVEALRSE